MAILAKLSTLSFYGISEWLGIHAKTGLTLMSASIFIVDLTRAIVVWKKCSFDLCNTEKVCDVADLELVYYSITEPGY